jgi:hypothetical protein
MRAWGGIAGGQRGGQAREGGEGWRRVAAMGCGLVTDLEPARPAGSNAPAGKC